MAVWCVLVLLGLTRGFVLSNDRRLFGLALVVTVGGTTVAARLLWRAPHTLAWTAEGSLVVRSCAGTQVVALEPPIEVGLYDSTFPADESGEEQDRRDLVIASSGDSIAVATVGSRTVDAWSLGEAVARGTGAEPPRPADLSPLERRRLRRDPTLRWLNAGGDFTGRQALGSLAALLVVVPATLLAGAALFAPPPPATSIDATDDVRRSLERAHEAFVTDLSAGPRVEVEGPLTPPTVDVVATPCDREHSWVWGPADASRLDTTAVVTLREGEMANTEERIDVATDRSLLVGAWFDYWLPEPDPMATPTLAFRFEFDGHDLSVRFSTGCLSDEAQRALRPAVEEHALRVLRAAAGSA